MSEIEDELIADSAPKDGRDPRLVELERLSSELYGAGIDFRVEGGRVIQAPKDRDRDRETVIDLATNHVRLGVVSDSHGGSKFEQLTALKAFYRHADTLEVDAFIHAGDFTQGSDRMHLGMEHEVHAHGSDAQVSYVVATYPKSERNVPTYAISGNHDDSFLKDGGSNVVRQIASRREDIVYLGQDAAYLTMGPLRSYIIHPDGGGSYAKSYKPQKLAESVPAHRDVRLMLIGHYHTWGLFRVGQILTFMLPCFQSQYAWLARKGLHPDIGGVIVDLYITDDGRIPRFTAEPVLFEPVENDWDEEESAAVNRSWSPNGMKL